MKQYVFTAMIVMLFAGVGRAGAGSTGMLDNWPAWRGPLVNGVAPHADPPVHWNTSENIKWKLDLPGQSNATPIIWADRVFVVTAVESERTVDQLRAPKAEPPGGYGTERPRHYYQFRVYCVDRRTGDILW
jgi:outer membrane protein assembly factor BamB